MEDAANKWEMLPWEIWANIFSYLDEEIAAVILVQKIFYGLLRKTLLEKQQAFENFCPNEGVRRYFIIMRTQHLATIKSYFEKITVHTNFFQSREKAKRALQFKQLTIKDRNEKTAIDYWRKKNSKESLEILNFVYKEIVKPHLANDPEELLIATVECKQPLTAMGNLLPIELTNREFLLVAVRCDDVSALEHVNPADSALEKMDIINNHMLHLATTYGSMDVLRWLLQKNIDFNFPNSRGETPLFIAVRKKKTEAVRLLLEKGVSVDSQEILKGREKVKCSPLDVALSKNTKPNRDIIKLLLANGASIHEKNTETGDTPLLSAIQYHTSDVVQLLVSDKTLADELALKVWHPACANRHRTAEMACYILKIFPQININQQDTRGDTALHDAVRASCGPVVKFLLELGVDPNIKNNDGRTAITLVNTGEIASLLLNYQHTEVSYAVNSTLLWEAAKRANYSVVKALIEYDRALLTDDYIILMVSHWSYKGLYRKFSEAERQLHFAFQMMGEDPWEMEPFKSIKDSHLNIIQFFLEKGLNPLKKNIKGKKASELADVYWVEKFLKKAEKAQQKMNQAAQPETKGKVLTDWMNKLKLKKKSDNNETEANLAVDPDNNNKRNSYGKKQ